MIILGQGELYSFLDSKPYSKQKSTSPIIQLTKKFLMKKKNDGVIIERNEELEFTYKGENLNYE